MTKSEIIERLNNGQFVYLKVVGYETEKGRSFKIETLNNLGVPITEGAQQVMN